MILLRLISFGLRILFSFLFVFILQIRWDKKPLEHYFVRFAQSFFVTKVLNQTASDGAIALRDLGGSPKKRKDFKKETQRQISSVFKNFLSKTEGHLDHPSFVEENKLKK